MINAYYNGAFSNFSDVKIPLTDRCVFFGDGIYDAAIGRHGSIFLENEHLDRFINNAKALNIPLNMEKEALGALLHRLIKHSGLDEYFIYFQATRYSKERNHSYEDTTDSNLLITVKEHKLPDSEKRLKIITENDARHSMCNIKTLNLLPAVLASKKAVESGCDEAVFIRDGKVTECAHSNISIVKDGTLLTHPKSPYILPGITRERMLSLCRELSIPYKEIPFTYNELAEADSVLVTSTTKLCLLADSVNGLKVGKPNDTVSERIIYALKKDFYDSQSKEC